MKKLAAAIFAAIILLLSGTGSLALVASGDNTQSNPPVFISNLVVSDAWMSGLTKQNWQGALQEQTYVEGSKIWFIATISVSAYEDTDSGYLWSGGAEEAVLTVSGKENCLNFSSASLAHFAKIRGMDVLSEEVDVNEGYLVEARADRAAFTFSCQTLSDPPIVEDKTLIFQDDLAHLKMDGIFPADMLGKGVHQATKQKDYYLHFMAVANAATEGVCTSTLSVDDTDAMTFLRDPDTEAANDVYTSENWYSPNDAGSNAQLHPGNRSYIYRFTNTQNNKTYTVMKISGSEAANNNGWEGPFNNTRSIYVIMDIDSTRCYIGIAVSSSGQIQGLVYWNSSYRGTGMPGAFSGGGGAKTNARTWDAANYSPLIENNNGNDLTVLGRNIAINATDLRAIFRYFGIARTNPGAVSDETFLAPGIGRSGSSRSVRETTAEARYNVSSGNKELDDLFVTKQQHMAPALTPAPTTAPEFKLPGPLFGAKTPEPTASPEPSASPSP